MQSAGVAEPQLLELRGTRLAASGEAISPMMSRLVRNATSDPWQLLTRYPEQRCFMGDKGKKDKSKIQKQHVVKNQQQERAKEEKQPKRPS